MGKRYVGMCAALLATVIGLSGASCSRIQETNAISPACSSKESLEVCASAVYGTFVIFEEFGRSVAEDPKLPNGARQAIIRADEVAKPVADSLLGAFNEYRMIRAQLAVGKTTEEKLLVATSNLNRWITEAAPLIRNLVNAVNDATKEAAK